MSEFTWDNKYSIGNAQIDAEHQTLIELANDVDNLAKSGEKIAKIKIAIIALYDYVKTHFHNEEEYMTQIDYPKSKEHQQLHKEFYMDFEFDQEKSHANKEKHGLDFAEVHALWDDPDLFVIPAKTID